MTIRATVLIAVVALLCLACDNKAESVSSLNRDVEKIDKFESEQNYKTTDSTGTPQQLPNVEQNQNDKPEKRQIDWDKKIVKTANLKAEVKDYKSFSQQLTEKIRKYGGYISQEEQSQSDYKIENSVIIKIPVDQFENALNELTKDVSKLNEKRVVSEDVTTQLIDGKSRLEAKKQVRLRYLDLLKQAKNMEEILTVQKEINDIQEDIETVNGRINFLSHSSAMSTINFTFFQITDASSQNVSEKKEGFLDKVKLAFSNGWYWIGEVMVGLISIWPLLLAIILGIWFFRKKQMPKIKNSNPS
jgi:hypothetical protein